LTADERQAGFVSLFNGRDFTGWRFTGDPAPADVPNWKVADGVIQLAGGGRPHLATQLEFGDFEMRFEWRALKPKYNSGFFIRSGKDLGSSQLNLAQGGEGAFLGGTLQGAKAVGDLQKPAGEWNEWRVTVTGDRVAFWCNGKPAWEGRGLRPARGFIGLQAEGAAIEFRRLRIREIQGETTPKPPDEPTGPFVRIASGVSGHIHPAACVARDGTVVVIFGQSDYKDLRVSRSTDGGKTWSPPVPFAPSEKLPIYPGALTTLNDGRIVHVWNTWYPDATVQGGKSRYPQYSISSDAGQTWSEPRSLPKQSGVHSVLRHPIVEFGPREWLFALMDKTVVYDPQSDTVKAFGDGRNHGLVPIVRTARGTLVSGIGARSTDSGRTWRKIDPFPRIGSDGWRHDLMAVSNGWLVASEVIGPGVGGDRWRFVVSRDDGQSWDFEGAVDFYNPGRPIGGRACPKTIQLDPETLGTVFYDVDAKQAGGPGVFFLRTAIERLKPPAQ
jgi:hypothetical protein